MMRLSKPEIEQIREMNKQGFKPGNIDTENLLDTIDALQAESDARVAVAVGMAFKSAAIKVEMQFLTNGDGEINRILNRFCMRIVKFIQHLSPSDADRALQFAVKEAVRDEAEWWSSNKNGKTYLSENEVARLAAAQSAVEALQQEAGKK